MDMELLFEIRVFFLCGLCGIACGIIYDLIRILRRTLKVGTVMTFLFDILFWILCAVLIFFMLFYANYGRARWYEIAGLTLGAASYFVSVSGMVVDGGVMFLKALLKLVYIVLKTVFYPVFFIYKKLSVKFCKIKSFFSKKIRKNRLTMGRFWFKMNKRLLFLNRFMQK